MKHYVTFSESPSGEAIIGEVISSKEFPAFVNERAAQLEAMMVRQIDEMRKAGTLVSIIEAAHLFRDTGVFGVKAVVRTTYLDHDDILVLQIRYEAREPWESKGPAMNMDGSYVKPKHVLPNTPFKCEVFQKETREWVPTLLYRNLNDGYEPYHKNSNVKFYGYFADLCDPKKVRNFSYPHGWDEERCEPKHCL